MGVPSLSAYNNDKFNKNSLSTQPTDVGTSIEFLFGLNIRHGATRTSPASSAPAKPLDPQSRGELM